MAEAWSLAPPPDSMVTDILESVPRSDILEYKQLLQNLPPDSKEMTVLVNDALCFLAPEVDVATLLYRSSGRYNGENAVAIDNATLGSVSTATKLHVAIAIAADGSRKDLELPIATQAGENSLLSYGLTMSRRGVYTESPQKKEGDEFYTNGGVEKWWAEHGTSATAFLKSNGVHKIVEFFERFPIPLPPDLNTWTALTERASARNACKTFKTLKAYQTEYVNVGNLWYQGAKKFLQQDVPKKGNTKGDFAAPTATAENMASRLQDHTRYMKQCENDSHDDTEKCVQHSRTRLSGLKNGGHFKYMHHVRIETATNLFRLSDNTTAAFQTHYRALDKSERITIVQLNTAINGLLEEHTRQCKAGGGMPTTEAHVQSRPQPDPQHSDNAEAMQELDKAFETKYGPPGNKPMLQQAMASRKVQWFAAHQRSSHYTLYRDRALDKTTATNIRKAVTGQENNNFVRFVDPGAPNTKLTRYYDCPLASAENFNKDAYGMIISGNEWSRFQFLKDFPVWKVVDLEKDYQQRAAAWLQKNKVVQKALTNLHTQLQNIQKGGDYELPDFADGRRCLTYRSVFAAYRYQWYCKKAKDLAIAAVGGLNWCVTTPFSLSAKLSRAAYTNALSMAHKWLQPKLMSTIGESTRTITLSKLNKTDMTVESGEKWVVASVVPGSETDLQGIVPGNIITSMNGISTNEFTADNAKALSPDLPVTLVVADGRANVFDRIRAEDLSEVYGPPPTEPQKEHNVVNVSAAPVPVETALVKLKNVYSTQSATAAKFIAPSSIQCECNGENGELEFVTDKSDTQLMCKFTPTGGLEKNRLVHDTATFAVVESLVTAEQYHVSFCNRAFHVVFNSSVVPDAQAAIAAANQFLTAKEREGAVLRARANACFWWVQSKKRADTTSKHHALIWPKSGPPTHVIWGRFDNKMFHMSSFAITLNSARPVDGTVPDETMRKDLYNSWAILQNDKFENHLTTYKLLTKDDKIQITRPKDIPPNISGRVGDADVGTLFFEAGLLFGDEVAPVPDDPKKIFVVRNRKRVTVIHTEIGSGIKTDFVPKKNKPSFLRVLELPNRDIGLVIHDKILAVNDVPVTAETWRTAKKALDEEFGTSILIVCRPVYAKTKKKHYLFLNLQEIELFLMIDLNLEK
ncbi:PDZ domain-containing protein [Nereida ignava]|uniref:PDZ domain-containing protein n=1 Tax=Nereida ignava TaxID=282199 RepID=UPI0030FB2072